jgi:polyisoprenoid-binding protein YceI
MTTSDLTRSWRGVDLPAPGTYIVDPSHTTAGFMARHLMVTKVRGSFAEVSGSITIGEDPLETTAEATMAASSFTTGSSERDAHVKSPDFLDVDTYPSVTFRTLGVSWVSGSTFEVTGELTIRDVSREVTLEVDVEGVAKDPWGGDRMAVTARGEINREDWGLTWNVALEGGGALVGKKVVLEIDAQLVRQ